MKQARNLSRKATISGRFVLEGGLFSDNHDPMGNFVHVYPDSLAELQPMIGSGSAPARERVVSANEHLLNLNPGSREDTLRALDQLLAGSYPTEDDHPDASSLIHAFHLICRAVAPFSSETEIDVDEERFPEIWDFVWSADPTPFHLPLSEWGAPAVGHWKTADAERHLGTLRALDFDALASRAGSDYRTDIEDVCRCLSAAREKAMGVFVFYFE